MLKISWLSRGKMMLEGNLDLYKVKGVIGNGSVLCFSYYSLRCLFKRKKVYVKIYIVVLIVFFFVIFLRCIYCLCLLLGG